jgi:hypothetical protein
LCNIETIHVNKDGESHGLVLQSHTIYLSSSLLYKIFYSYLKTCGRAVKVDNFNKNMVHQVVWLKEAFSVF